MAKLTPEMIKTAKSKNTSKKATPPLCFAEMGKSDYASVALTDKYITFAEGIISGNIVVAAHPDRTYSDVLNTVKAIPNQCINILKDKTHEDRAGGVRIRLLVSDLNLLAVRTMFSKEQELYSDFLTSKQSSSQKKTAKHYHELVLKEKEKFDKIDAKYSDHTEIEKLIEQYVKQEKEPSKRI